MKFKLITAGVVAALAVIGFSGVAGATNLDVSVSSGCQGTTWVVTPTIHNAHNTTLHFVFSNPVENWSSTVDAGKTKSIGINVEGNSFHYEWSTTDGILVGKKSDTLSRPAGCMPATTVPETSPPTTTCAQAIPVRDDCGGSTTVPPVVTTLKVCADGNAPSITVEDGSVVCPEFGAPPASSTTTTMVPGTAIKQAPQPTVRSAVPAKLPATGGTVWYIVALAGIVLAIGIPAVRIGRHVDRTRS